MLCLSVGLSFAGMILIYSSHKEYYTIVPYLPSLSGLSSELFYASGLILCILAIILSTIFFKNSRFQPFDKLILPENKEESTFTISINSLNLCFMVITIVSLSVIVYYLVFKDSYYSFLNLFWILSIVCPFLLLVDFSRVRHLKASFRIDKSEVFFIIMLLLAGLALLIPFLSLLPSFVTDDEGFMGLQARKFLWQTPVNIFGFSDFFYHPNLSFYPLYLSLKIFSNDIFGLRLSSVIISLISLPVSFYLFKILFNRNIAALSVIFMLFSHVFIAHARIGFNNTQSILLFVMALLLLVSGLKKNSFSLIYLTGVLAGLGFYSYFASRTIIIIVILYLLYLIVFNLYKKTSIIKFIVVSITGFTICCAPLFIETIKKPYTLNKRFYDVLLISENSQIKPACILQNTNNKIITLLNNTKKSFLLYFSTRDHGTTYQVNRPFLDFVSSILFILGLPLLLIHFKKPSSALIIISAIIIIFFCQVITKDIPGYQRIIMIIPLTSIICSLYISTITDFLLLHIKENSIKNMLLPPILLYSTVIAIIIINIETYYSNYTFNIFKGWAHETINLSAYAIKNFKHRYDFYTVYSNFSLEPGGKPVIINLDMASARFLLNDTIYKNRELEIKKTYQPFNRPVNKDVVFLIPCLDGFDNTFNILHSYYPSGRTLFVNNYNGVRLFLMYIVNKNTINTHIKELKQ
jgi:4-amino-4-deoxy-L-arabinose transferase-like glycosyltransferase